jgi:hypothetical protein
MIDTTIVGHLAHDNILFDSTCSACGGIFSSSVCPKCGQPSIPITTENGRKITISEGTIYPLQTQEEKDFAAKARAKRKNAMEIVYRFVLLSFADKNNDIIKEHPLHKYLAKGRQILIKSTREATISWFKSRSGEMKCEIRYNILTMYGDKIELLGGKKAMENTLIPEKPLQTEQESESQESIASKIENIQKLLAEITGNKETPTKVTNTKPVEKEASLVYEEEPPSDYDIF